MHSDTVFSPALNYTSPDLTAVRDFLKVHETEERPCFTEAIKHHYDEAARRFGIMADGQALAFTREAYLEFCSVLGIPGKFADRIPNDLLTRNVEEMLDDNNQKVRLLIRDGNIVSGVKSDNYVTTNPRSFIEAAEPLLESHLFREASVTDGGTSLLFEPLKEQTIAPDVVKPDDRYNIGIAFDLGYKVGIVEARPYSLRHVCTNVAISASDAMKHRLVEKLRRNGSARYYSRLLENYTSEAYKEWMQEVSNRIAKALNEPMTDFGYMATFGSLNKLVGKEVALAIIGVSEDTHDGIILDVNYKKKKGGFSQEDSTAISDLQLYDVFNSVTAAGKGYSGRERVRLQEIGGALL